MSPMTPPPMTRTQQMLAQENTGLAKAISHDYTKRAPGLDIEEVVAVAYQGLVDAAIGYDPEKGVPFGAWARQMIHYAIRMWMRNEDYLQRNIRGDYKKMLEAGYTERGGITDELAEKTGLKTKRMVTVLLAVAGKPTSTENFVDAEAVLAHPDVDVESSAFVSVIQGSALGAYKELSGLQQVVVAYCIGEGYELRATAEALDTSVAVVREALNEAVMAISADMARQARSAD
jgi:RNA polymerase sigma factor (sigma-70 family)